MNVAIFKKNASIIEDIANCQYWLSRAMALTGAVSSRPSKQQIVPDHIFLSFCKVQRRKVCTACQQVVQRYDAVDVPVHRPGVGRAVLVHVVYRAGFGVVGGQHAALLSVQDADIPHVLARHIALLCQLCLDAVAAEILAGRVVARAVAVFIAAALVHPHQPAHRQSPVRE